MKIQWHLMDTSPNDNGWYWVTSSEGEIAIGYWALGWHFPSASLPPAVRLNAWAPMEFPEPYVPDPPVVQLDIEDVVHTTRKK